MRAGGFRVGVVDDIKPKVVRTGGKTRSVALVTLKLDKTVEPLAGGHRRSAPARARRSA